MSRNRTILGVLMVAVMLVSLLTVFIISPTPAEAAGTTSLTVTKYDAHGNVENTTTVTYQWMEANLTVQGDGTTRYYFQGPTFDNTNFNTVWNPAEDVNVESRDYGRPKGTDVKDLCNLVGGASAGDTIRIKAADNLAKWFDYEDVYNPEPEQGKLVVCWYNADYGGYVPTYDTGMRLLFFADASIKPGTDPPEYWHVFGLWNMHNTLPESRWYYFSGQWPSSSGLSVQIVSNINIYEPNLISCDASGNAKENFAPGETVYVKGLGLAASTSYKLWIQPEPVSNNRLSIVDGNDPTLLPAYQFNATSDPSGTQETTTTDTNGDFGLVAIWDIDSSAATPQKYDIVADSQAQGTVGKYDIYTPGSTTPKDFIDSPGFQGFTVAAPTTQPPVAAFTADVTSGTAPLTVSFTDQSTEIPTSWAWDFNNDSIIDSTIQNPSYTYSVAGTYTVNLTVTNAIGSDSEVKSNYVTVAAPPLPVAAFSADVTSGSAPLTVHFTDQSTGIPTAWSWDFDNDGVVDSTTRNPSYTYNTAGTYTLNLTVNNTAGSNSEVKTDYITVTVPTMALLWGPYLTGTTTTGTVVNVKTTLATTATVEYATEADYTASGIYNHTATDSASDQLHHIALSGLDPNTVYHYRVLYGTESTADCHFRTFPTSGPFTFIVCSDTQDQLPLFSQSERYKLLADNIAAEPDVDFVLIAGDLVNNGDNLDDWNRFFEAGRLMLANTTVYTALGNHEDNSTLYYDIFGLSEYYSFDCSDAHFTVLDSNTGADLSTETGWLDSDLDSGKTWKFAMFHHPLYTSDPDHFGGWANLRLAWEGLFQTHGVAAVWNGHIHAYERYLENGTQYMVMGTGGGPLTQLSTEKYDGYQNSLENSLAYAKVTVDPAAGTTTVQIIRVADISPDNTQVSTLYPRETVFETFVLNRAGQGDTGSSFSDWMKAHYVPVVVGVVVVIGLIAGVTVRIKARGKSQ